MSHNWMRSLCNLAVVVVVLMGWGCKKSSPGMATADAGPIPARSRSHMGKPALPLRPTIRRRVAQAKSIDEVRHINTALRQIHKLYKKSYEGGRITDWTSYLQAKKMLQQVRMMEKHMVAKLRKRNPVLARQLHRVVAKTSAFVKTKSHPQRLALLHYKLMFKTKMIEPSLKATLLTQYRVTTKQILTSLAAYGQAGPYRVGIQLQEPRAYYRWYEQQRAEKRILVKPGRRASHLLVVHLSDATTRAPLSGTDVSVEILDAKTGRQLSTHRLEPMWTGKPVYVRNLTLPKKAKNVLVQVSISAFPLTRTQEASKLLLQKGLVRFAASVKAGKLVFAKASKHAKLQAVSETVLGADVLRAIASVGGTILETPIHRIGLALLPTQGLYLWKGGSLVWKKPKAFFNTQVVAFIQDKKTGLLVPNARIQFFYAWVTKKGGNYEFQKYLKPVYDGFPSYRAVIRMKPTNYTLKVRVDAPMAASLSRVRYPSYSTTIKDFRPPLK